MTMTAAPEVAVRPHSTSVPSSTIDMTVLVPTFNERDNVAVLVDRLTESCKGLQVEILFVDDSLDDTAEVISSLTPTALVPIRLLHRTGADRVGGLSGAVVAGLQMARGRHVVVMDGDLQHPPELVPAMAEMVTEPGVDLVVAARWEGPGQAVGFDGVWRRWVSGWATVAARSIFPGRVGTKCADPMTGFFCVDTARIDIARLRPQGFKILLELLVRHDLTVRQIPFVFEDRAAGASKASMKQGLLFVRQLLQLRVGGSTSEATSVPQPVILPSRPSTRPEEEAA